MFAHAETLGRAREDTTEEQTWRGGRGMGIRMGKQVHVCGMNFCSGSKFLNFIFVSFLFYHVALVCVYYSFTKYCQFMHYTLIPFISLVEGEINASVGLIFSCCVPIGGTCTPLSSLLQQFYCWGFPTYILPQPIAILRPISDPLNYSLWVIFMVNKG